MTLTPARPVRAGLISVAALVATAPAYAAGAKQPGLWQSFQDLCVAAQPDFAATADASLAQGLIRTSFVQSRPPAPGSVPPKSPNPALSGVGGFVEGYSVRNEGGFVRGVIIQHGWDASSSPKVIGKSCSYAAAGEWRKEEERLRKWVGLAPAIDSPVQTAFIFAETGSGRVALDPTSEVEALVERYGGYTVVEIHKRSGITTFAITVRRAR